MTTPGTARWAVRLEAAGSGAYDLALLERLTDVLGAHSVLVTGSPEEPLDGRTRYGAQLSIGAADAVAAGARGRDIFVAACADVGLPPWPVVLLEVVDEAGLDAQLQAPGFPELLGIAEVAARLGTSRARASAVARLPGFPTPVARLAATPVWLATAVDRFLAKWPRQVGWPRGRRRPAQRPPTQDPEADAA
jgi:hypothetical protein